MATPYLREVKTVAEQDMLVMGSVEQRDVQSYLRTNRTSCGGELVVVVVM